LSHLLDITISFLSPESEAAMSQCAKPQGGVKRKYDGLPLVDSMGWNSTVSELRKRFFAEQAFEQRNASDVKWAWSDRFTTRAPAFERPGMK